MRAAPRSHQDTKEITVAATPSTLSSLQRTGSKTDGLRLHWDDVASTKSSLPDSARTSHEQDSNSGHHLAYLSAQDLSIPDLRDSEIVGLSVLGIPVICLAHLPLSDATVTSGLALPSFAIHNVGTKFQQVYC